MQIPAIKSKHTVRAVAVPTTSYVAGTAFTVDEHNYVAFLINYTKGDETSLQVQVESSIDGGTTWGVQASEGTPSSGEIAVDDAFRTYTATGKYWLVVSPIKADQVRLSVKSTGGTPTGTVGVTAVAGWV